MDPVRKGEVESAIKRCKNGRTPGIDGVNNELLNELPDAAVSILVQLFSNILSGGNIPQIWKRIILVPIPKKGKNSEKLAEFRPVALSCALVKIFERVVLDRMIYEVAEREAMSNMQHGFRAHKRTHTSIICITQQIMDGFNQVDTLSKGKTKLKSGLFCLDLKGGL